MQLILWRHKLFYNAGMDLRNNSNINVATFGTTTKFFDGSGHADSNRKLQLNADGIFALVTIPILLLKF